jgi:hypothetical protein
MGDNFFHEIDETKSSTRDYLFEELIKRVEKAGEIKKDVTSPLFAEIGTQEGEVGEERVVEFNLNRFDYEVTRKTERQRISGEGRVKHLEPMSTPRISVVMKRKPETSNEWQVIDLEDFGRN